MRVPILDGDGLVVNVIVLSDDAGWIPPDGLSIGQPGGEIGDVWNGSFYERPEVTPFE